MDVKQCKSIVGNLKLQWKINNVFVVVNFDALAQASGIQIEMRQAVFLCWMQDSNLRHQIARRRNGCWQCNINNVHYYRIYQHTVLFKTNKQINSTQYKVLGLWQNWSWNTMVTQIGTLWIHSGQVKNGCYFANDSLYSDSVHYRSALVRITVANQARNHHPMGILFMNIPSANSGEKGFYENQ